MRQERFHLVLVHRRQVGQAPVDGGRASREVLVVCRVQRLLAQEPPQPLDQVQVGRVTRQVQQFDLQRLRQACTTAHFWYRALSSTSVIGNPTPASATARNRAQTDSALM